jgi:hypothetical protein
MGSRHEPAKDRSESQRAPADNRPASRPHTANSAIGNLDVQRHLKGALAGDVEHAQLVAAELGEGSRVAGSEARVHSDATAARLADAADAHAFTIGNDIVLARDAPQPGTLAGDALLAHELAHVQQQAIGGGGPEASSERDADLAGASVVADRLGLALPLPRRVTGTRLSLQRCWRKDDDKAKDGPAIASDGGPKDATVDAALPPGKRSWVASTIAKATKSGSVTGKDVPSFDAAAAQFGGNKTAVAKLISQYNPNVDETKIGPKTKFDIPTSIEMPTDAEALDDVDDPSSVAYWTWKVEEDPKGPTASLNASVPSNTSGVTLGHGYDMKERSADQIETQLIAAGVDEKIAKAYRSAAGLSGKKAKAWVKKHASIGAITAGQEKQLFSNEYQATTNAVIAETLAKPEIGAEGGYKQDGTDLKLDIDLAHLKPVILAFVVDLRFRGDLLKGWPYIKEAVRANDLAKLQELVGDVAKHKKYFYDNYNRYKARCSLVGIAVVDQKTFDAT